MDPLTSLIRRWRLEAALFDRTGHPGAAVRSVDIQELEEALQAFVNEPLNQTAAARLLEIDPATVRRRDRTQRLRNVGRRNRPLYLRGEIQKLPPEWGQEGEEQCKAIGMSGLRFLIDPGPVQYTSVTREQVARAIAAREVHDG